MVHAVIVEDEKEAADELAAHLRRYFSERGEDGRVTVFTTAVDFLSNYRADYDVVFLDIEMPMLDGMTAAEKLRALDPYVIIVFVTNMQQYAIKGYSVGALDFVIKPVTYFAFETLMNKVMRVLGTRDENDIVIGSAGNIRRVPVSRLLYVEVARHRLTYHTEDGVYEGWGSLSETSEKLPTELFSRCNACYLVALRHVKAVEGDNVVMDNGDLLRISHLRKKGFLSDLAGYLGRRQ